MNASESAEEIVKMTLDAGEVAIKIVGTGAKNLAVLLYAIAKNKKKTKGKIDLNNMLKTKEPLQIFTIKEKQLKEFNEYAKQYGVLYTALIDRKHQSKDGIVDILVKMDDSAKINRIVERFNLANVDTVSIQHEIEKDKIDAMIKEAKKNNTEIIDVEILADEILAKPKENNLSNQNFSKTGKNHPSENFSMNKNNSKVDSNKRPSVRKELNKIKMEQKVKEQNNRNTKTHIHKKNKNRGR